jgi:hypothetical protein
MRTGIPQDNGGLPATNRAPEQSQATHTSGRPPNAVRRRARPKKWHLPIIDGPFAESKEMLGGSSVARKVWMEEL